MHNLVISNVPGPQVPLYYLGCEITAMYPLGPVFHGSGLNMTVMSLNGRLNVGLIAAPSCCRTCGNSPMTSPSG